jgi:hypothetical protein
MMFGWRRAGEALTGSVALVACALVAAPVSLRAQTAQPFSTADPVAMVEEVDNAPDAGVEMLDYVYADQDIDLGARGALVLSYFESCVRETITGGRVKVGPRQSRVRGGRLRSERGACEGETTIVTADASEAGGAVKRVTPFKQEEWQEVTIKGERPIFKWRPDRRAVQFQVMVVHLDAEPLRIIWQGQTKRTYLAYPASAPRLEIGMPYLVQITNPSGQQIATVFSIDPWLDMADNAANRIVTIGR